jgi:hypothetical protein
MGNGVRHATPCSNQVRQHHSATIGVKMMKKLLLASTSAFVVALATPALAGGSSTVYQSQTGNNQQSTIDQTGATSGSVGTEALPFVQQNGSGWGSNVISITQTGDSNAFGVSAQSWQSGGSNSANVTQNGTDGDILLQQSGNSNGSSSNTIFQGAGAVGNKVTLQQTGDSNQFWISQDTAIGEPYPYTGTPNTIIAVQSGNLNIVSAGQYGAANKVNLTQWNNNNQFLSDQGLSYHTSYASIANAFQWSDNGGGANLVSNTQGNGTSQKLYVDVQYGHDNAIYNRQTTADFSILHVSSQSGSFLTIDSQQTRGGQTANVISQTGDNSRINNRQSGAWYTKATFTQNGSNQLINNTQTGGVNTATFVQSGTSNQIDSNQSGDGNTVTASQYLFNSYANLAQAGNGNTIVGTQTGYGTQNQAYVAQSSNGNTTSYNQNGSGNYTNIKQ